ncbi:MAG: DUF7670 domain-containing protein [Peptococcaceae bacterium]
MAEDKKVILLTRWTARLTSIGFTGLFILFLIGEGNISGLSIIELELFLFVPVIFILGCIIGWTRELWGGSLIFVSVIGFNVIDIIASWGFSGEIEFWFLIIPGVFFLLTFYLANSMRYNKKF